MTSRSTRLIVGGWQLSAGHRRSPRERAAVLEDLVNLVDHGFTTFDCADIYTGVEALFGELRVACKDRLGSDVASRLRFHTKLVPDRSRLGSVDRNYVRRIVERSLKRLKAERLDLVQFAWWDYDVPGYVETAMWLEELRVQGLIARIGVTNFDVPRLCEILKAGVAVETNQIQYSVLDHRPENGMTALCRDHGIALLCYGTLAGGFLSDRYVGAPVPDVELSNRSLTKYRLIIEEFGGWQAFQQLLEVLREVGRELGGSVAQVALAYVLSRPGVASVIVGMSSPKRIEEAVFAMDLTLPSIQFDRIRQLVDAAPGPLGDCFGLEREKDGRHAGIMKYDLNLESTSTAAASNPPTDRSSSDR